MADRTTRAGSSNRSPFQLHTQAVVVDEFDAGLLEGLFEGFESDPVR